MTIFDGHVYSLLNVFEYSLTIVVIALFKCSTSDSLARDAQGLGCSMCNKQLSVWFVRACGQTLA